MIAYLDGRKEEVKNLHQVYNPTLPVYLLELLEIPELLRIQNIGQHSGIEFTKLGVFNYHYSKLDHAFGVASILEHFVNDRNQVIAGLLHEIATPAFNSAVYYMDSDIVKEDFEMSNYDAIVGSDGLFDYFLKNEISINDVCDISEYTLAYGSKRKLTANRLEGIFEALYYSKLCSLEELRELYEDLIVVPNEDRKPEFCFETFLLGKKFCRLSMECDKKNTCYDVKLAMQFVGDLLGKMIKRGDITKKDLYLYTDKVIMDMGLNSGDRQIRSGWEYFCSMDKVYTKFNPVEGKYCKTVLIERECLDPLIQVDCNCYQRISILDTDMKRDMEYFDLKDTDDLYMYVDYEL